MKESRAVFSIRIGDLEVRTHKGPVSPTGGPLAEIVKWQGETCFVIAFIENKSRNELIGDMRTIGDTPFDEKNDVNMTDFVTLVKVGLQLTAREYE